MPLATATLTVTDGDGDTATATVGFQVTDANAPSSGSAAAAVDDDGLPGGNPASTTRRINANIGDTPGDTSEATFTGVLGGSVGTDGAGANGFWFAGLNGTSGTVGTETVSYSWDGGTNTLTATGPRGALFKVQITDKATGAYTVTLLDNVLHATGPNNENSPDPTTSLTYSITDADGSTATGTLTITFDDDAPTATSHASQNVAEGATVTGTLDVCCGRGRRIGDAHQRHGAGVWRRPLFAADRHWAGCIKVKADGSYSFTADAVTPSPVPLATATLTVTDGDGDTATATVNFQVTDANTPSSGSAAAAVDDDGLTGGNPASTTLDLNANIGDDPGDTSEATFTGVLGGSVGTDGAGANGFSFAGLNGTSGTVGTETVSYSWDGGTNTLTATGPRGALFKVQITDKATGAYTVTLLDNVLQATGPNNENSPDPTTSLTYSITDADGSTAPGTLTITFDDDAATATSHATQNVAEGATVTGTLDVCCGRGWCIGHAHQRHGAGVWRRPLFAADRHWAWAAEGEGGRVVLVHGGRGDAEPCAAGDGDADGDGRRRRHGDGDGELPGDGRQRAEQRQRCGRG